MIYNAFFCNADESCLSVLSLRHILILSLATSIDAFAVGISLAIIKTPILKASLIIGLASFVMSLFGAFLGYFTGKKFENKIPETLGGLILIFIGIKLLF
jgi:putative Mn2+ efflux pump MntP